MKALPLKQVAGGYERCGPNEATHIRLHVPGPLPNRILPITLDRATAIPPCWTWNGSVDMPTVTPSVKSRGGRMVGDVYVDVVCHSWIANGQIQFLTDCTHQFAGQTHNLLDVD